VYRGEHEPILSRDVFQAVQSKLAANAVNRQVRLRGSAAILINRLFDDRGNRMSPTHANKKGVRYRYYVSQALLQNRRAEAGSIARVPAPEVESLVCDGVRRRLAAMGRAEPATALTDPGADRAPRPARDCHPSGIGSLLQTCKRGIAAC
jgi:site-specific DNA recombinase